MIMVKCPKCGHEFEPTEEVRPPGSQTIPPTKTE